MMQVKMMRVTPKLSEHWLNNHNNVNRTLREGVAEAYAVDMKAGRWTTCIDPIGFYEDGNLANGQHRLYALLEAGVTLEFIVVEGLEQTAGLNIDTGFLRTIVDNGRISGADTDLTNAIVATARAVHFGRAPERSHRQTFAQQVDLVSKYREACEWAVAHGPKQRFLNNALVRAALARAWYYEDNDKLLRFCEVVKNSALSSGESESAAVSIRNYILTKEADAASSSNWTDTFLKVQNAIQHFINGRKLTMIRSVNTEAYPLDGRRVRKKAKA